MSPKSGWGSHIRECQGFPLVLHPPISPSTRPQAHPRLSHWPHLSSDPSSTTPALYMYTELTAPVWTAVKVLNMSSTFSSFFRPSFNVRPLGAQPQRSAPQPTQVTPSSDTNHRGPATTQSSQKQKTGPHLSSSARIHGSGGKVGRGGKSLGAQYGAGIGGGGKGHRFRLVTSALLLSVTLAVNNDRVWIYIWIWLISPSMIVRLTEHSWHRRKILRDTVRGISESRPFETLRGAGGLRKSTADLTHFPGDSERRFTTSCSSRWRHADLEYHLRWDAGSYEGQN